MLIKKKGGNLFYYKNKRVCVYTWFIMLFYVMFSFVIIKFIVDPFLDHLVVVVVVEDLCSLRDLKRYHQHAITNMQTIKKISTQSKTSI
jgi:hypothetical protein